MILQMHADCRIGTALNLFHFSFLLATAALNMNVVLETPIDMELQSRNCARRSHETTGVQPGSKLRCSSRRWVWPYQ